MPTLESAEVKNYTLRGTANNLEIVWFPSDLH